MKLDYRSTPSCPKCGSWFQHLEVIYKKEDDLLDLTCSKCKYNWQMETKDNYSIRKKKEKEART